MILETEFRTPIEQRARKGHKAFKLTCRTHLHGEAKGMKKTALNVEKTKKPQRPIRTYI